MKPQARVVAFDDGPFDFEDETVDAIGVVARGADYIEGILRFPVRVDGTDATSEIADAVLGSRHREGL
ncbi:MAG TPA: DUF99 family protein, partial [Burkholderiales bacterium]|nr:DUF99 family protein [Burkholderiales bacterium]